MGRKQQQYTLNVEQNTSEQVRETPCSLWKTFLLCLLACLAATAITALVFYFRPFGNPTSNTTIIINTDGRCSQDPCTSAPTPSPTSSPLPGSQTTLPSTPVTTPTSSTSTPTTTRVTTRTTTVEHEAEIEED